MAKYNLYATVTGCKFLGTVEANSEKEALDSDMAADSHVDLCHQCANEVDGAEITDITAELVS